MKKRLRRLSASRHDTKRVMSVSLAYDSAVRFIIALRFSFFEYFFPMRPIRGNCTD